MRGCILDQRSFDRGDIDLSTLLTLLNDWQHFESALDSEVDKNIADCEVVITNKVRISRQNIEQAKSLKLIMLSATGTDNVDLAACRDHDVIVCNARQYSNGAVVQHTFALLLNLMTNLMQYHDDIREGAWSKSDIFCLLDYPILELEGKTLGIIGYGNLGSAVANVARAFGMNVVIWQRPDADKQAGRLSLPELLSCSDVVSIHCPLTTETHHLISHDELKVMKPEAMLINTARGAIVDAEALASALRLGEIGGAGIDVLDQEPPPEDHALLGEIPNLILTPHNAWGTRESRERLVAQLAENLAAWQANAPIRMVS